MKVRVQFTIDVSKEDLYGIAYQLEWGSDPRKDPPVRSDIIDFAQGCFENELFWAKKGLEDHMYSCRMVGDDPWTGDKIEVES